MNEIQKAAPHLIMAIVVIAASVVLASEGIITGGEAIGLIGAAGGFTLGGTVASGSISTAATAAVDVSHSASQLTQTPSVTQSAQSPQPTAPTLVQPAQAQQAQTSPPTQGS